MMRQKGWFECPNCGARLNVYDYRDIMERYPYAVCECCGLEMRDWVWVQV